MSASTSNSNHSNALGGGDLVSRLAAHADISFAQFLDPLECMTLLYVCLQSGAQGRCMSAQDLPERSNVSVEAGDL